MGFKESRGKVCKDWARILPNLYEYPLYSLKHKRTLVVGGQEGFYFLPACHVANVPEGSPKAIYGVCNLINWTK
nr:MAG TPA: hypothetical protein [Inoviridae sp.]